MDNSEKAAKEQAAFERTKEITEKLEAGLKALFEGDNYKSYLNTMSKFHNYSFNNTMLIALQKPDATLVAGFNSWQKNFERSVNKGEKGIKIFAPAPYTVKKEQTKLDEETQLPVLDKDGKPITEEVDIKIPAFKVVSVFDVSQTNGKELPQLGTDELKGDVENFDKFFATLKEISPVPISFEKIESGSKGFYSQSGKDIHINEGMSNVQTIKTAIHEIAHAKLHDKDTATDKKDKNTKEVEAESVAYTVCKHFGIDTSDYSFAYVASWGSGKEAPELKASLETIRSTASELITAISDKLRGLEKTQENTMEAAQEAEKNEPKKTNIIGNTAYATIEDKQYFRLSPAVAEQVAAKLTESNVPFSGRIGAKSTTITIGAKDVEAYKAIEADVTVTEKAVPDKPETIQPRKTVVINAFGGAGAGKTTACMHIAAELKKQGFIAEYVPEYAKELVWDKNFAMLDGSEIHQRMILSEQSKRMERLVGKVDFIVTDSPTLLNGVYLNDCDSKKDYCDMLLENFNTYNNFNVLIERDASKFETEGRIHNLEQSINVDKQVEQLLKDNNLYYCKYNHEQLDNVVTNAKKTFNRINGNAPVEKTASVEKPSIIGNTPYKDIPDRFYIRMSAEKAMQVADILNNNGLKFSGNIKGDKATITISAADKENYKLFTATPEDLEKRLAQNMRKAVTEVQAAEQDLSRKVAAASVAAAEYKALVKGDEEIEEERMATVIPTETVEPQENHFDKPVILYDYETAQAMGEDKVALWRESNNENRACNETIADAISNASTSAMYGVSFNADKALEQVAGIYPLERIALVTVHQVISDENHMNSIDGRYSREVQEWAKAKIVQAENLCFKNFAYCNFSDKSHPVLVDSFAKKVIAMEKELERSIENAVVEDVQNEMNAEKEKFDALLDKTGFTQVTDGNAFAADGFIVVRSPEGEEQGFDGYELASEYLEKELQKDNVKAKHYELYNNGEKVGETPLLSEAKAFAEENANNSYEEIGVFIGPVGNQIAVPDASLIDKDMFDYGYTYEQMLPVSGNNAMELFNADVPLYQLHNDNTESLVEERADIERHISKGGMFGVEKPDWERHIRYMAVQNEIKKNEPLLEGKLLRTAEQFSDKESHTMVGIYQLKDGSDNHFRRFASLTETNEQPNRDNYSLVYAYSAEDTADVNSLRENVFEKFNTALPEDFRGHSLSVSDVVAINSNGNVTAHYCDKIGFVELEQFGEIKQPAVAEQEKPVKKSKKQRDEKQFTSLAAIKKVAEDIKKNSSRDEVKQKGREENAIAE